MSIGQFAFVSSVKCKVKKMNSFVVCLAALVALTESAPQYASPIPILQQDNVINPDGSYRWSYQTGNGIQAQEEGYLKNAGVPDQEAQVAQGSYSYTADDGTPISVSYIADELGFRASGAHLPTPPPIPPEIQASLDLISRTQGVDLRQYQNQYQNPSYVSQPIFNRQDQRAQLQRQNEAYYKTG